MKQKYLLIILLFLSSIQLYSQNEFDALRYSQYNISGTARYSSMSGAFGSLGGDFSGLSQNPAGLGYVVGNVSIYRSYIYPTN